MVVLQLRQLTKEQRARAFIDKTGELKRAAYRDAVREMLGDAAYAITVDGTSVRAVRVNMNRAAKSLGLQLRWVPTAKDAVEIICELVEPDDRPQPPRNPMLCPPR